MECSYHFIPRFYKIKFFSTFNRMTAVTGHLCPKGYPTMFLDFLLGLFIGSQQEQPKIYDEKGSLNEDIQKEIEEAKAIWREESGYNEGPDWHWKDRW
jgi:hypothetical protein